MQTTSNDQQDAVELTQNMLASAAPTGVFGEVMQNGDTTLITASETVAVMGVGGYLENY